MEKTTIERLMAKKSELLAELREHGAGALKEEFKKFFEAHPACTALRWRQYTPHFNDGDACTFSVNDITFKLVDSPEDAGDYSDGFEDRYGRREDEVFKATSEGVRALEKIDDEIFQIAFGDHVKVTATREGFEVDEYEHD